MSGEAITLHRAKYRSITGHPEDAGLWTECQKPLDVVCGYEHRTAHFDAEAPSEPRRWTLHSWRFGDSAHTKNQCERLVCIVHNHDWIEVIEYAAVQDKLAALERVEELLGRGEDWIHPEEIERALAGPKPDETGR